MTDINDRIAESQRARDFKEGLDAGFRDGDRIRTSSDRPLPWWVGTPAADGGVEHVLRPGLATVDEALVDGGLDFDVALRPLLTSGLLGRLQKVPGHYATVREDTGSVLGIVGRKYRPIQFRDGLADFGRSLIATDEASVESAGTMYGGRVGMMWFELDHLPIKVAGEKAEGEVRTYLGLTSSHDGSSALTALITPVRWVCKNTLNLAKLHARAQFKVRHSGDPATKVQAAQKALGLTRDYMAEFEALANALAGAKVPDADVKGIMETIWPVKDDLSDGWSIRHPAALATKDYFESDNLDPIRGTGWAVLNAAVEYVDHEAPYHGRLNALDDVKTAAVLWGRGARAKDRALAAVREYTGV
jgi:phage/plasmid-like protein (TIGR03299 family)